MCRHIDLKLYKVKGHSGSHWNDRANILVKEAVDLALLDDDRITNTLFLFNNNVFINIVLLWNSIGINRNIREFCNRITNALEESQWSCNSYWTDYFSHHSVFQD